MKDSRIGAYGAIGIVCMLAAKLTARMPRRRPSRLLTIPVVKFVMVDALAITGDEGRSSLRKATGSWQTSFDP